MGSVVQEKAQGGVLVPDAFDYGTNPACDSDIEKFAVVNNAKPISLPQGPGIQPGRPDMANLIPSIVGGVKSSESTIVAVYGLQDLILETRSAVAGIVGDGDGNITLHCEQLGGRD